MSRRRPLRSLPADRRGSLTLEWALILAAVALPMAGLFQLCLHLLGAVYESITLMNSMPFP